MNQQAEADEYKRLIEEREICGLRTLAALKAAAFLKQVKLPEDLAQLLADFCAADRKLEMYEQLHQLPRAPRAGSKP